MSANQVISSHPQINGDLLGLPGLLRPKLSNSTRYGRGSPRPAPRGAAPPLLHEKPARPAARGDAASALQEDRVRVSRLEDSLMRMAGNLDDPQREGMKVEQEL